MGNIFGMGNAKPELSWMKVLILGLIPLGQLWARINYFKGSLDKWWLMFPILLIPPFSFIPLLLMKFGFIKDGQGSDPLDKMILVPIIAKFIIPFVLPYIIDNEESETLFNIVAFIIQLLTIMIANLGRRYFNCQSITLNSIGKSAVDSTIANGMGDIVSFGVGFIPFIGLFVSLISIIPVIGDFVDQIMWVIGFAGAYIVINMFNQHPNINKFCNSSFFGDKKDLSFAIVSLIISLLISIFNKVSPI